MKVYKDFNDYKKRTLSEADSASIRMAFRGLLIIIILGVIFVLSLMACKKNQINKNIEVFNQYTNYKENLK